MQDRDEIDRELTAIEVEFKELSILYEQYFSGVEKREPIKKREAMELRLRRFANRRIIQTNLRFRYQNLASRFHTYAGNWDRTLRLIEEGRYHRSPATATGKSPAVAPPINAPSEADIVFRDLLRVHQSNNLPGPLPERQKVEQFLALQKEKIREKFGDKPVEFRVELEGGKPKIKVRPKQQ